MLQFELDRRAKWLLVATFAVSYLLLMALLAYVHFGHIEARRANAHNLAQGYAQRIQERLQTAMVSTYVLASAVKQSHGDLTNFNDVAAELLTLFPSVSALQLAPDGVIRDIYPLQGNENAIGHDLLGDRTRSKEAAMAITLRQLTLAGPFKLVQGGVGTVGRLPIFLLNERKESYFWGFANALMRIPGLLDAAGMNGLERAGYRYELWRSLPEGDQRDVFARNGDTPLDQPVDYVITIFNGRWVLSVAPSNGWVTWADYFEVLGYGLIGALLVTLLQYFCIRYLMRRR